jgi:predicted RNA-binding protein with PUA-like domain
MQTMKVGDEIIFYHSNAKPPGAAGVGVISKQAEPDPTQFDVKSDYYDPKSSPDKPRWFCPTVKFKSKFKSLVPISELREMKGLEEMLLLKKGSRLSVTPLSDKEFKLILKMGAAR